MARRRSVVRRRSMVSTTNEAMAWLKMGMRPMRGSSHDRP